MKNCPHCGADQYSQNYQRAYLCGSITGSHRTRECRAREPLWKELQSAKARIEVLEKAGNRLFIELIAHNPEEFILEEWRKAKEVKP